MGCSGFKPSPAPLNDLEKKSAATDHTVCVYKQYDLIVSNCVVCNCMCVCVYL